MRILYVINSFSWGGAEKLVFDLSQGIKKNMEWVGIAALYRQNNKIETSMRQQLQQHGVETFILNKRAGRDRVKTILSIADIIKKYDVDLIHGHCSVPMLLSKIAGKLEHKKVVCTIHNTRGYSKNRERFTQFLVDAYISIGEAAENYMVNQLGIEKKRIHRIYNAIDVIKFTECSPTPGFWRKYGGSDEEISILNVARVSEQKNQMCLLKCVKRCVNNGMRIRCYILGSYDDNDSYFLKLQEYIHQNHIEGNIKFLGMHNNVEDFLSNADCFVMSSWYEGLSVAFLEAVVSGTPIVCSEMPFVSELNNISRCCTTFRQNDDKQLAETIFKHLYFKPKEETIKIFSKTFSMRKFVSEHEKLYLTVI